METKLCPKCNILQDVNNFNKAKKHKDGLSCHCKNCISKYKKEYYLLNSKNIKERVSKNSLLKTIFVPKQVGEHKILCIMSL